MSASRRSVAGSKKAPSDERNRRSFRQRLAVVDVLRGLRRCRRRRLPHARGRACQLAASAAYPGAGRRLSRQGRDASLGRSYAAIKTNANFPQNRRRAGLPTIQGAILLFDSTDGTPLALLDSIEITIKRTAAATAIAARYLALPESRVATICGCGEQGRAQLAALRHGLKIEKAFAWDVDYAGAAAYARAMSEQHGIEVTVASDLRDATRQSDVIVTCTSSAKPYLGPDHVRPGTFIAAVGADNPEKSEVFPELMARATVVADLVSQSITMGDTHHAIRSGAMSADAIYAELGELIIGRKAGRQSTDAITL